MTIASAAARPSRTSVLLHVGIAETLADRGARGVGLAAGHRVGAIIGGVEGARAVVARQAEPAERRGRRRAIGRLVPVDHAGPDVGPELVVHLGAAADEARGKAEAGVVGFVDRGVEVL